MKQAALIWRETEVFADGQQPDFSANSHKVGRIDTPEGTPGKPPPPLPEGWSWLYIGNGFEKKKDGTTKAVQEWMAGGWAEGLYGKEIGTEP